jgi:hypothetical protein
MIQKQKGRVKSGSMVVRLTAKRRARVVQKSRSCPLFFFIFEEEEEFVPQGHTVNATFYMDVLKRLRLVRPELWTEKNWILHHDNAPSHSALTVREFFAKNYMITTDHPSYSPDLAPSGNRTQGHSGLDVASPPHHTRRSMTSSLLELWGSRPLPV